MQQEKANMFWCMKTLNDRRRPFVDLRWQRVATNINSRAKYQVPGREGNCKGEE